MICTFFGNSDCPPDVAPMIEKAVSDLIVNRKADCFLVGNHGNYDRSVYAVLKKMKNRYPSIRYSVVLAYMPMKSTAFAEDETLLPTGIETVPRRLCISYRNRYMVKKADCVIAYIRRAGNAEKFVRLAERAGKTVIYL